MASVLVYSGYEWLGKIPYGWELSRVGELFYQRSTKVSDEDYAPLSVTMKGVIPQLSHVAKSDDHANRKLVCKGDFAINSRSDRRNACGFASQDGSVSLINTICVPRAKIMPGYYEYLFSTEQWADEYYSYGHGIVADLWTTSWSEMKKIVLPVPPTESQVAIANYLDSICGRVDSALSALVGTTESTYQTGKSIVDDLKAYKQSLIYEVVTGKREI